MKRKVLLIGWDAADWKFLSPLMDEGVMPNLTKLVEGGSKGRLATLDPPLSPTLWTSIATGKRPYKHGIHGFTEPDPSGKGIRPINNTSRKVKAIWNILTQKGYKSNVIGWWPSHPAEPINGVMVSNFFQNAGMPIDQAWPMAKGTIHPPELESALANLRVHPQELTEAHVLPFIPKAQMIDQKKDKRLLTLNKITADCSSIQAAATYLMEHTEWDFTAVYFDAIDHYCHGFMKFHPPYRAHIDRHDFDLYKDVVRGGCIFHDMMLGRLLDLIDDDTTVLLISDHGFHPDHNRPKSIPNEPSGPAIEHSPYGIIVARGPEIKKDELIYGASLLDITPTILALLDLPVASDMDGKVLKQIFKEEREIEIIDSWENVRGEDGSHKGEHTQSEKEIEAELRQLIDLGYIKDPGDDVELAISSTANENNYYLARSYFSGGKWKEGISILQALHQSEPNTLRYAQHLLQGYLATNSYKKAREVLDTIRENTSYSGPQLDVHEATLLMAEKRFKKAIELFKKTASEAGNLPGLKLRIANAYVKLNKLDKAQDLLKDIILENPEDVYTHYTLGICHFMKTEYQKAVSSFLDAIGLMYHLPAAHFYLGESLLKLEKYDDAIGAFETCLKLVPGMNNARERIINIYTQFLDKPGLAYPYQVALNNRTEGEIIIVSGLPRSGTSMMMQMLEAGGIELFTDKEREADINNPKGYYEHEEIKNLSNNKQFLKQAKGKAVKVIAQLLPHLPSNYKYKIVFMERDLLEVISSQQSMLTRMGKKIDKELFPLELHEKYQKTLQNIQDWAQRKANVEVHYVNYHETIELPLLKSVEIAEFLNTPLDPQQMINAVDPKLYREKSKRKNISTH